MKGQNGEEKRHYDFRRKNKKAKKEKQKAEAGERRTEKVPCL